jgi:uncharacterized protein involved in exopolysaccharide biosynthesis
VSPLDPRHASGGAARQTTAREFVAIVFRRKWLIVGLFVVTTATILAISFTTPVSYMSSGRVLYKRGEQTSALDADIRLYGDWEQELGSEMQLIESVPVLDHARGFLRAASDSAGRSFTLSPGAVDVEVMGKSNVIAIGYADRDPVVAQVVCDAVIRAYIDYRETRMGVADPSRFFDAELDSVDRRLNALGEERRRYLLEHGLVDVSEQKRTLLTQLAQLEQQRAETDADLAQANASLRVTRELQQRPDLDMPMAGSLGVDALQTLKQKVIEQEARIAQLRERYRDESAEIVNATGTLEELRAMLKREVEARLEVQATRSRELESRLRVIRADIAAVQAQLDGMPISETRLANLDREVATLKERHKNLLGKSDLARVNENVMSRSRVFLLSPAGPAVQTNTRDYVRLALAPAFSLVVGVGLAFFLDGLDITVRTAGHVEAAAETPVLATLRDRRRRRA